MSASSIALITANLTSALGGISRLAAPDALTARCDLVQACYARGQDIDALTVGELLRLSNTLSTTPSTTGPMARS